MNTIECIKTRRSIRTFKAQDIPAELLQEIVDIATYAPSWKNTQTTRYFAITDKNIKKQIVEQCFQDFQHNADIISSAPVLMVVATVNGRSGYERDGSFTTSKGTHWQSFDAGIATQTLCLSAHEKGLATVIMGIFDESKVASLLEIPDTLSISALLAIGYPAEDPAPPKRKTAEDLLTLI